MSLPCCLFVLQILSWLREQLRGKKLVFTDSSVQAPHPRHNTEAYVANTNIREAWLFSALDNFGQLLYLGNENSRTYDSSKTFDVFSVSESCSFSHLSVQ